MPTVSSLVVKIQAQNQQAMRAIGQTRQGFNTLGASAATAQAPVQRLNASLSNTATLANTVKTALVGLFAVQGAGDLVRMADEYQNMANQLLALGMSSDQVATSMKTMRGIANETRNSWSGSVVMLGKLIRANDTLGLSQERLEGVVTSLNRAITLSGSTTASANAAMLQFGQAMSAGLLRGEEFNSISEQTPVVLDAIAKGLGVTRGELRKYAMDGKLTAELVVQALEKSSGDLETQFNAMETTVSQSLTILRNNFVAFIGDIATTTGGAEGLASSIESLALSLGDAGKFVNENINLLSTLATLYGVKLAASIGTATAARIGDTVATARQAQVEAQAARAKQHALGVALRQAQAEVVQKQNMVANGLATKAATGNTVILTKARLELARANQAVVAAERALAASHTLVATTAAKASIATRTLAGAVNLMGGPAGALMIAAYAGWEFSESLDDLQTELEGHKTASDLAKEATQGFTDALYDLSAAQVESELSKIQAKIKETKEKLDALRGERDSAAFNDSNTGQMIRGPISQASEEIIPDVKHLLTTGEWVSRADADRKKVELLNSAISDQEGVLESLNGAYRQGVERMRSFGRGADTATDGANGAAGAIDDLGASLKGAVSDFDKLIGKYDQVTKAQNDYDKALSELDKIKNVSETERAVALGLMAQNLYTASDAYQDLTQAQKAAKDLDLNLEAKLLGLVAQREKRLRTLRATEDDIVELKFGESEIDADIKRQMESTIGLYNEKKRLIGLAVSEYDKLLGSMDDTVDLQNTYRERLVEILSLKDDETRKAELLKRLEKERTQEVKNRISDLKKELREMSAVGEKFGKLSRDTGSVDMDSLSGTRAGSGGASESFTNVAQRFSRLLNQGGLSAEGASKLLAQLTTIARNTDSTRFDKSGMLGAVANLADKANAYFEAGGKAPQQMTAAEFKEVFENTLAGKADEFAQAQQKRQDIKNEITTLQNYLGNTLDKLTQDPEKTQFGTVEFKLPREDGGSMAVRITTNAKGAKVLKNFVSKNTNNAARQSAN